MAGETVGFDDRVDPLRLDTLALLGIFASGRGFSRRGRVRMASANVGTSFTC